MAIKLSDIYKTFMFENNIVNIKMNGSVAVGTSSNIARADHVHASDTSKVPYSGANAHVDLGAYDLSATTIKTPEIKTDTTTPTDLQIRTGANKTLELQTVVYDDINFSVGRGRIPGSNFPAWAAFCGDSNNNAYQFGVGELIDLGTEEMYHDWKEGTVITPHVHIVLSDTIDQVDGEKVQFRLYYSIGNVLSTMSVEGHVDGEYTVPDTTPVRTHVLVNLSTIDLAGYNIGACIICQIQRIAKSAGGTELSSEPFVLNVGLHVQKDTIGSRQITTK